MKKSLILLSIIAATSSAYAADGISAVRQGNYTTASGKGSVAVGMHAEAIANLATATGPHAKARGVTSQAYGSDAQANGYSTTAIGKGTRAEGAASTAIGAHATSTGNSSAAMALHAHSEGHQSIALGQSSHSKGNQSAAVGSGAKSDERFSTAVGTNSHAVNYMDVAVGSFSKTDKVKGTSVAEVDSLKIGKFAGHRPTSAVSFGSEGFERQVQNVAAGNVEQNSTDAINGSQLYAVTKEVAKNRAMNEETRRSITNSLNELINLNTDQDTRIAINANKIVTNEQQISTLNQMVSVHNTWNQAQSEAIDAGIKYTNSVDEKHTAWNQAQDEALDNLTTLVKGLSSNEAQLRKELYDAKRESRAGIAGAVAMTSLMQPYEPGQTAISVGAGTFRNEGAIALGASRITTNGKWGFKGGAFVDTRKHWGAGVSAAYFFGAAPKRPDVQQVVQPVIVREVIVREVKEETTKRIRG